MICIEHDTSDIFHRRLNSMDNLPVAACEDRENGQIDGLFEFYNPYTVENSGDAWFIDRSREPDKALAVQLD